MGYVQYFVAVLMLSAQKGLSFPLVTHGTYQDGDRMCFSCPAGQFQKSCTECEPCPAGTYTDIEWNNEESCHPCYRDCSPKYHLRVVKNCTSTADLKCVCEPGYSCIKKSQSSENCKKCVKTQDTAGLTPRPFLGPTKGCQSPACSRGSVPTEDTDVKTKEDSGRLLVAIFCPFFFMIFFTPVILFCMRHPKDETCYRQTMAKLCKKEGQDTSNKSKDSVHQSHRDSFSAKQQSLSATNEGSVHVHNPGTVIFSLLSHFTGQVGPTIYGSKTTERANSDKDEQDKPVFHPPSSPSIHISEEERNGEISNIFFPSQEQGKDCHMSKEESM
ncbi:unnamed protein product [Menidia menidia]|uniref:(Atlantic silverside) hypothetical protein n=1 Tax=Menidia menidia TaxID=238744 RepID=A0A8S4BXR3_9TELE|nr:unnamed protein product [Menidia menidia]